MAAMRGVESQAKKNSPLACVNLRGSGLLKRMDAGASLGVLCKLMRPQNAYPDMNGGAVKADSITL